MPGVHRLQHVEHFIAAHFADDDAVWPHAQRVAHQIACGDRALAFEIRRARFKPHDMAVFEARSEEHTSELQSLMRISYAVFCLKKKKKITSKQKDSN